MTPSTQDIPENGPDATYSVNELADEAGVTRRTVHYYISQGLLPPAGTEGPGTRYSAGHLDRLHLIKELQREHLPLAEIRTRLERLSDDQVRDLLNVGDSLPEPRGTAFDYIQSVLAGTHRRTLNVPLPPRQSIQKTLFARRAPASPAPLPAPSAAAASPAPARPAPGAAREARILPSYAEEDATLLIDHLTSADAAAPAPRAEPSLSPRSQWERISLAPDVELHVRRPQSRLQNRAVDKLVALARQLLEEDPS